MQLFTLDPMFDRRWSDLAATHPRASVFHQLSWLEALHRTYGYRPIVLTSTPPGGPLSNGIAFCEVKSWITGSRLVSLPFADHAEPLLSDIEAIPQFTEWMLRECIRQNWKYVELRPLSIEIQSGSFLAANQSFWLHTLDLEPSVEKLFCQLHKNCLQRRIKRAEHEHLSYEKGTSDDLLNDFYRLQMITRRRHQLLPQPRSWFRNLVASMGPNLEIWLARKDGIPIAAILALYHRRTVVYKYGCSDERFHHLAGMPFLFWKLIEESKMAGAEQLDLGRTDIDNAGLVQFKDRFGATCRRITYLRYSETANKKGLVESYLPSTRRLFSVLPDAVSSRFGQLLYRHIG
jgi:CelD/BcsL family acetyltransferase involved in cellulose biosynthesis